MFRTPTRIEWEWAGIFFLLTLAWMSLEKSLGWHDVHIADHALYTNIYDLLFIILMALAIRSVKLKRYHGSMSWKQGIESGMWITLILAAISPLTQWITHRLISPSFFPNIIQFATDNHLMTPEAAAAQFNLPNYIWQNVVGTLILGTAATVVLAHLFRTKERDKTTST